MKTLTKYSGWIVVVVLIFAYFYGCSRKDSIEKVKKKVTVTIRDTIIIDSIVKQDLVIHDTVIVYKYRNRYITKEEKDTIVVVDSILKPIRAIATIDTTVLINGTIFSKYLSEGQILKASHKLQARNVTRTEEIVEEIYKNNSGLFAEFGAGTNPNLKLDNISAGLNYVYRNKASLGLGATYGTANKYNNNQPLSFNVKIGFRIK